MEKNKTPYPKANNRKRNIGDCIFCVNNAEANAISPTNTSTPKRRDNKLEKRNPSFLIMRNPLKINKTGTTNTSIKLKITQSNMNVFPKAVSL